MVVIVDSGAPTRQVFATATRAQFQLEVLITAKQSEGFTVIEDALDEWPSPDDLDAITVAADERQRRNDPRGEIMALQVEIVRRLAAGLDARELIAASVELLVANEARLFGTLAGNIAITTHQRRGPNNSRPIIADFKLGYVDAIAMSGSEQLSLTRAYAALRANPIAQYVRSLSVGSTTGESLFSYGELSSAISTFGMFPHLRRLSLGDVPTSASYLILLGDLGDVIRSAPALEELVLRGDTIVVHALPPTLVELDLEGGMDEHLFEVLRSAPCRLQRLRLHVRHSSIQLGRAIHLASMQPDLRRLTLSGFYNSFATVPLDTAQITAVLETLTRYEHIDLSCNGIPDAVVRRFRDRLPHALLYPQ